MFIEYKIKLKMRVNEKLNPQDLLESLLEHPLKDLSGYEVIDVKSGKKLTTEQAGIWDN